MRQEGLGLIAGYAAGEFCLVFQCPRSYGCRPILKATSIRLSAEAVDAEAELLRVHTSCIQMSTENVVQVSMVDVAATPSLEELLSLLDESETVRAQQSAGSANGAQLVIARAALRVILGRLLGVAPREVPIGIGDHGKPLLTQGTLCFNVSHTQGLILIAVRETGPIGIDVETTQRRLPGPSAQRRILTEAEACTLDELPPAASRRAFFQVWSRKEAYAKGLGLGLGLDFRAIEVGCSGAAMIGEPPWGVRSLPLREPHVGAVAAPDGEWHVSVSAHSW